MKSQKKLQRIIVLIRKIVIKTIGNNKKIKKGEFLILSFCFLEKLKIKSKEQRVKRKKGKTKIKSKKIKRRRKKQKNI